MTPPPSYYSVATPVSLCLFQVIWQNLDFCTMWHKNAVGAFLSFNTEKVWERVKWTRGGDSEKAEVKHNTKKVYLLYSPSEQNRFWTVGGVWWWWWKASPRPRPHLIICLLLLLLWCEWRLTWPEVAFPSEATVTKVSVIIVLETW